MLKIKEILKSIDISISLFLNLPFYQFGKKIWASKEQYLNLFETERVAVYPEIDILEKKIGYSINKDWLDNLALHTQVVIKKSKINYQHGRILYSYLRKYLYYNNNIVILETGTSRGFSSLCMAKALYDSKKYGKIYTIDIIPNDLPMIWNCIDDHEKKKTRVELLSPWKHLLPYISFLHGKSKRVLHSLTLERINFAFLDAMHKWKDLHLEFKYVEKRQIKNDLIVFDDVTKGQFDEVIKYLKYIESLNKYKIKYLQSNSKRGYAICERL